MKKFLIALSTAALLGGGTFVLAQGSGPYSAQIQRALASFVAVAHTWVAAQTIQVDSIGTTTTNGLRLTNTTAAALGAQQYSPGLSQVGQGWSTTSSASMPVETRWELRPVQGAAAPTVNYVLMSRVNGGAWTDQSTFGGQNLTVPNNVYATAFGVNIGGFIEGPGGGVITLANNAISAGVRLQFNATPTVASGFGTSPSITTGSTDTAGSVNVGTGGAATSGVIGFATTWSNAPFCLSADSVTGILTRASASTTQLTLTGASAWTASDVIQWLCIGAK